MGITINIGQLFVDNSKVGLCNYFVANRRFWEAYVRFIDAFLAEAEKNAEYKDLLFQRSANYALNGKLPYYSFTVERLFSLFLAIFPEIRTAAYTWPIEHLIAKVGNPDVCQEIVILEGLKTNLMRNPSNEVSTAWVYYRNKLVDRYPDLMFK
jgi:hypothetical protein